MDYDRNLLFATLALQVDLINRQQFVEALTLWAMQKEVPLSSVLIEKGWIVPADSEHIDYLLKRKQEKEGRNGQAPLATVSDGVKRLLATIVDPDIQKTLVSLSVRSEVVEAAEDNSLSLHRYTLVRLHADGGIGRVWIARDSALARNVALKELRPETATNPSLRARFLNEARITSQLEHPGIVPVYEVGRWPEDEHPFYTMRFVKGRTLTEAIKEYHNKRIAGSLQSIELLTLLNAFVTVCQTIAYAHDRGIIHRDLKGQNVILGNFGEVVVLDWGLAKVVGSEEIAFFSDDSGLIPDDFNAGLTAPGQAVGTPAYMAPEQAIGQIDLIDHRTDVYGLGAILYEILTGGPPFSAPDVRELLRRVRNETPIPPSQVCADVPPLLEAICLRAISKQPADRYPLAIELAQQVQRWLAELAEREHAEQQRARFFALSLDLLAIAGFDGYFKQLNPAWERTLGWTIEELSEHPWVELIHPDDVAPTIAAAQGIMDGNLLINHENRYRCKDGSYKWLLWNAREIVGEELIYAVARDITDRKHAEA